MLHLLLQKLKKNTHGSPNFTGGSVVVVDIDQRKNFNPKEFVTFNGEHFELCGIVNHGGRHYTGCTKSANGFWNQYNDSKVERNKKLHYGPRMLVYQKITSS